MKSLRMRVAVLGTCCVLLLSGGGVELLARGRQITVYNPGVYNRTRQTMSNRAAMRAALRRKRAKRVQRARRRAAARRANVR